VVTTEEKHNAFRREPKNEEQLLGRERESTSGRRKFRSLQPGQLLAKDIRRGKNGLDAKTGGRITEWVRNTNHWGEPKPPCLGKRA